MRTADPFVLAAPQARLRGAVTAWVVSLPKNDAESLRKEPPRCHAAAPCTAVIRVTSAG